jgi:poly(ADP-ribose) glycohydrolase ARH3
MYLPFYPKDKVLGVLFGTFIGDALGAPFEFYEPSAFPEDYTKFFMDQIPTHYTDDFQMTLSVFEELLENGKIFEPSLRQRFLKRFNPNYGYGSGTSKLIEAWKTSDNLDEEAGKLFRGEGNLGNGAAMRVAPVSLFFKESPTIVEQAKQSAVVTHTHHLGIDGAVLIASAVNLALNEVPHENWFSQFDLLPIDNLYKEKLIKAEKLYNTYITPSEAAVKIGNSDLAVEAVSGAIFAVLRNPEVYATDLHGHIEKYEAVFEFALSHKINLIHLGADLLPKAYPIFQQQREFVTGYFKDFIGRCRQKKIEVLAFFGNDDLYVLKDDFRVYAQLLDEIPFTRDIYNFTAYGYVPDYPFALKTACKLDYSGWKYEGGYLDDPVEAESNRLVKIKDIGAYFRKKGTIEEDLKTFKTDTNTIVSFHCPPANINLDVCNDGRRVGSKSVYEWIEKNQPLLVLCGHIHESPKMSGKWKEKIGKSIIIQPGQKWGKTTLVLIDITDSTIRAEMISIN